MSMLLPKPPPKYSQDVEARRNLALTTADDGNRKKGADIELSTDRLILHASDGSRWQITVSTSGVVGATAL